MRENWRWDSTATASSSQPDISLFSLFSLLLLILLQLLKIRICLVEHQCHSSKPDKSIYPCKLDKKTTCDVTMQCAPKWRNDPHNLSSAIFIWNIYPLEKVTGSKVASKLKSDEGYVGKNFFSAEFNCSDHREITIFSTDTIQNAHSLGKWDNTTADIILSWNIRTFITKSLMSSKQDSFFATTGCWRQEALTRPSTKQFWENCPQIRGGGAY